MRFVDETPIIEEHKKGLLMKIQNVDSDFAWGAFGMAVLATLIVLAVTFVLKEKKVDGYYMSAGGNSTRTEMTCVYAHWTWHPDELAFCTNDVNKAIEAVRQLNQTVR